MVQPQANDAVRQSSASNDAQHDAILADAALLDEALQLPADRGRADGRLLPVKVFLEFRSSVVPAGVGFQIRQELFLGSRAIGRSVSHGCSLSTEFENRFQL